MSVERESKVSGKKKRGEWRLDAQIFLLRMRTRSAKCINKAEWSLDAQ